MVDRERELVRLAASPDRLAAWARVARPAAAGSWGPRETARHLVTVERVVWHARLDQLAAGDTPRWSLAEPGVGEPDEQPLDVLLEVFAAERRATLGRLGALDDAGWARIGIHERYGVLDVAGLCRLAADHDDEHLAG